MPEPAEGDVEYHAVAPAARAEQVAQVEVLPPVRHRVRAQRVGHLPHLEAHDRVAAVAVGMVLGEDGANFVVAVFGNEL